MRDILKYNDYNGKEVLLIESEGDARKDLGDCIVVGDLRAIESIYKEYDLTPSDLVILEGKGKADKESLEDDIEYLINEARYLKYEPDPSVVYVRFADQLELALYYVYESYDNARVVSFLIERGADVSKLPLDLINHLSETEFDAGDLVYDAGPFLQGVFKNEHYKELLAKLPLQNREELVEKIAKNFLIKNKSAEIDRILTDDKNANVFAKYEIYLQTRGVNEAEAYLADFIKTASPELRNEVALIAMHKGYFQVLDKAGFDYRQPYKDGESYISALMRQSKTIAIGQLVKRKNINITVEEVEAALADGNLFTIKHLLKGAGPEVKKQVNFSLWDQNKVVKEATNLYDNERLSNVFEIFNEISLAGGNDYVKTVLSTQQAINTFSENSEILRKYMAEPFFPVELRLMFKDRFTAKAAQLMEMGTTNKGFIREVPNPDKTGGVGKVYRYISALDVLEKMQELVRPPKADELLKRSHNLVNRIGDFAQANNQEVVSNEVLQKAKNLSEQADILVKKGNRLIKPILSQTGGDWPEIRQRLGTKAPLIKDTINEVAKHMAASYVAMTIPTRVLDKMPDNVIQGAIESASRVLFYYMCKGKSLDNLISLSDLWHLRRGTVLDLMRDFVPEGQWHPLFKDKEFTIPEEIATSGKTKQKICIINITNAESLTMEGDSMDHCVGGKVDECLKGKSHVFSIKTETGGCLSTFEIVEIFNGDLKIDGKSYEVSEHRGVSNKAAPEEAEKALAFFKKQINDDKLEVNLDSGEIKVETKRRSIENKIGLELPKDARAKPAFVKRVEHNFQILCSNVENAPRLHVNRNHGGYFIPKDDRGKPFKELMKDMGLEEALTNAAKAYMADNKKPTTGKGGR